MIERWSNGMRGVVLLALLTGAARLHAQTPPVTILGASSERVPVVSVRIVTVDGRVLSESPAGIAVETGKPLEDDQVAQSLRTLYSTGEYADVRAETTPVADGLRLDFVVTENLFFNQITFEGLVAPPTDASASAAMQITLGQPYRRYTVDEGLERLHDALKEEGLYTAVITAETLSHPEAHQMDVVVHVKSGPRARVGAIHLKNGTEYSDAEILARLKLRAGQTITTARLQRDTDRIRKYLVKKEHLSARAVVHLGEYDAVANTVPLELDVTEGPLVRATVTGTKLSKGDQRKLIPIYQEGAVDTDLLEEGKRNIRERLEREGYFDAKVDYNTENREVSGSKSGWQGTEEIITYKVARGERHKLVGIEITGNHYFDTELLRSRLQIFGGAFASPGRFSGRLVESDAQSMRNLYISNGFTSAKVAADVKDDYQGKSGDLFVRFNIEEGPQTRVASLAIEGVHAFKEDLLLGVVGATPGQPYSEYSVATDRDNILALYFNEGFPQASFSSTAETVSAAAAESKPESSTAKANDDEVQEKKIPKLLIAQASPVRLVYHIVEGPQTHVRRILLSGYVHTKAHVIRREIKVKAGDPLREGDVVESQRLLYNLGIFNRVTIEAQNPNGSAPDKDVVVLVEEAKRYTVAYGGGFEVQRLASTTDPTGGQVQAAPRGILEVSKLNLTGRADSLSLKLRGSTLEDRALLGYSLPTTFGNPQYSFQATAYTEKTQDINTFTEMRYEGSVQLTHQITPRTTLLYRYTFRKVKVSNLKILSDEIPLFLQPTLVSQFGLTWIRDTRDNPADASRGTFNSADLGDADTKIGSSASFLRFFFQNSTYYPIKRRFSFARSVRFGILVPYRDTVSLTFPAQPTCPSPPLLPNCVNPTLIPLPERFFAGGGTSLRGFALNQAGPRDAITGFPVGGQALLILNQELRFPMRLPYFGTSLGGAIFYDGGNVYSRFNHITFNASVPRPTFNSFPDPLNPTGPPLTTCATNCSNELNYFAHTVGIGLRYATPVGPIRVDLGYQINRPFFVVPCTPITSATNMPPNCFKGTQLPRLQIFFNLGSSF